MDGEGNAMVSGKDVCNAAENGLCRDCRGNRYRKRRHHSHGNGSPETADNKAVDWSVSFVNPLVFLGKR